MPPRRDKFTLQTTKGADINTSSYPDYNAGSLSPRIQWTDLRNLSRQSRCNIRVWSRLQCLASTRSGLYRIYIPGLGVSDAFRVDEAIWYKVARNAAAGEYHQRNGIALDGRFGYTRGVTFKDGVNDTKIYWSRLPTIFSSEWAVIGQAVPSSEGAKSQDMADL